MATSRTKSKSNGTNKKIYSWSLNPDIIDKIQALSEKNNRSRSNQVEIALTYFLENNPEKS